jgi:hypothetical protein
MLLLQPAVRARHTRGRREVAGLRCNVNGNEGERHWSLQLQDGVRCGQMQERSMCRQASLGDYRIEFAAWRLQSSTEEDSERSRELTLTRGAVNISCGLHCAKPLAATRRAPSPVASVY